MGSRKVDHAASRNGCAAPRKRFYEYGREAEKLTNTAHNSVADPDVFGPPGSKFVSTRYRSGSFSS